MIDAMTRLITAQTKPLKLLRVTGDLVSMSTHQGTLDLPRLPLNAVTLVLDPAGRETPLRLRGWVLEVADRRPVTGVWAADSQGTLHRASRVLRPDVRAVLDLDYDMTGFEIERPEDPDDPDPDRHCRLIVWLRAGLAVTTA